MLRMVIKKKMMTTMMSRKLMTIMIKKKYSGAGYGGNAEKPDDAPTSGLERR